MPLFKNNISNWVNSGNTIITGTTTNPTKASSLVQDNVWTRRVGDSLEVRIEYVQTNNTGAAAGSGDYLFAIPGFSGLIDTTKMSAYNTVEGAGAYVNLNTCGWGNWANGTSSAMMVVSVYDSSNVRMFLLTSGSGQGCLGSAQNQLTTAGELCITAFFTVPIVGWSA